MGAPKVVVYAGPTISPQAVRAALPDAVLRPPAARGDLLAEDWSPGDTAVLVDGYFRERRSVGHKEILWLLSEGVHVVGAASMGALRAAELAPCGMRGVGAVYRMYASAEIEGDDEVGVLHGPAERGYPPQTVALVNLRHGCREGAATGEVPPDAGGRIIAAAKALPFVMRSWPTLEQALGEEDRAVLNTLRERIGSGVWDVKRLDAQAVLADVAAQDGATWVPAEPLIASDAVAADASALTGISHNLVLARRSRREYAPGRWISDLDVLTAARLFDPGYAALHEEVLGGLLRGLAAERDQSLAEYAQAKLGVDGSLPLPESLAAWLAEDELGALAPADRLRLVMTRVWPAWHSADWRPAVLARLRASGRWQEWADTVVRADEAAAEPGRRLVVPPPAICGKLFLRHWQRRGSSAQVELARRGFADTADLGAAARRFFALDVRESRGPR
jgi:hypothetical protein